MKFKTTIGLLDSKVYYEHIIIPKAVVDKITADGNKRVLCTVNDHPYFHAGLMPKGDGNHFIILNKKRLKAYGLAKGEEVTVRLEKDTSKYGMEMPQEFQEVLDSDPEGETYFEQLTDGKKRNLIHLVAKVKNIDLKITKALIICDHLKANQGQLDFKLLNEAMKIKNRKF